MKTILSGIVLFTMSVWGEFSSIDNETLLKMQAKGVPVIDIRTPGEWQNTGIIKGAHTVMFFDEKGRPDMANWFFELGHLIPDKNKPFIIYCAHANRTRTLGEFLDKELGFAHVYDLKGGIEYGWIRDGKKPTVKP
jgi:rhodanese-related sulfurtransferase